MADIYQDRCNSVTAWPRYKSLAPILSDGLLFHYRWVEVIAPDAIEILIQLINEWYTARDLDVVNISVGNPIQILH